MFDGFAYAVVALTFCLAGMVHGAIGLGLATVSLAVLSVCMGLQPAMASLLAPSLVIYGWQAVMGGYAWMLLSRLWFFMLAAVLSIWLGVLSSSSMRINTVDRI